MAQPQILEPAATVVPSSLLSHRPSLRDKSLSVSQVNEHGRVDDLAASPSGSPGFWWSLNRREATARPWNNAEEADIPEEQKENWEQTRKVTLVQLTITTSWGVTWLLLIDCQPSYLQRPWSSNYFGASNASCKHASLGFHSRPWFDGGSQVTATHLGCCPGGWCKWLNLSAWNLSDTAYRQTDWFSFDWRNAVPVSLLLWTKSCRVPEKLSCKSFLLLYEG